MNVDWGVFGAAVAAVLIVAWVVLAASLVITILFLVTLQGLLNRVSPQNRKMQPSMVWLNLIPVFNLVWAFITVVKVTESVRAEYASRGLPPRGDFAFGMGITYAILAAISGILGFIPTDPYRYTTMDWVQLAFSLVVMVFWIIYWVKCSGMKKELERTQPAISFVAVPQYPVYGAPGVYGAGPYAAGPYAAVGPYVPPPGPGQQQCFCSACGAVWRPEAIYCMECGKPAS